MAKIGRPLSNNPSTHRATVRFTESEYRSLKQYAESHNLTITQAIKCGIELLYSQSHK